MKTNYYFFLLILLLLSACTKTEADILEEQEAVQTEFSNPNILLIIADDMGLDATPGYDIGNVKPNMPNLVSMMNNGIRFTNLWSAPLCSPTRAGMLTGKYGFRTGVTSVGRTLSTSETSIHSYLDAMNSGYSHAVIGKWHLGDRQDTQHPNIIGVENYSGMLSGTVNSYFNWDFVENMQSTVSTEYSTTKLTDLAIDWIGDQSQPWFLWLAYNAPHTPFHLPPNDLHSQGVLPSDEASIAANPLPYYLAMLEAMDSEMGRLFDALRPEDKDNTIIIFVGDNGTPNQVVQTYNRRRAKNSIYQGGIHVPMVISGSNVTRKGVEDNALIGTIDLFATIAALAGEDITSINDSKNFTSLLNTSGVSVRDYLYSEVGTSTSTLDYTLRDSQYKLMKFSDGNEALYDLMNDPMEEINLLNASQLPLSDAASAAKLGLEAEYTRIIQ
ncbi:sulfatase-like hydrolase/transferase [Cognatitamlana onchidii]|uniref:sulfatase-like hydrolase/transferase n=1 Tax=Cognatitamlana onchidii TaxID=2562860 RepID=UPI0010A5E2D1|nr:sulfatase-like hydrolase/transferase [Algibacter onchidii]